MANHYFKFKQFTVQQENCAMKVSTDACLQGAWTPIAECVADVLDIGAGTGLLSLMLAQRNTKIIVDAIELDEVAAQQARENVASSPWRDRISVIAADVRTFSFSKLYDLAICNPPFFSNSLLGDEGRRNLARHTVTLSHANLLNVLSRVLSPHGYASILLPVAEHQAWEELLFKNGWYIHQRLCIHHRADSPANRIVSLCSRREVERTAEEKLTIFTEQNRYSSEATELLKAYYLNL